MRKLKWWWSMFFWGHGTLLVNVYLSYCCCMQKNGLTPMSHYKFRRSIVLAKIAPDTYGAPSQRESIPCQRGDHRGRKGSSTSVRSRVAAAKKAKMEKGSTYVTATQVANPSSLFHAMRTNPNVCHLPVPVKGVGKCCVLCRWATGNKYTAQLSHCEACATSLCVWCYKIFHTIGDLESQKNKISRAILGRKKPNPELGERNHAAAKKRRTESANTQKKKSKK